MPLQFAEPGAEGLPLHLVENSGLDAWLKDQPERVANWVRRAGFEAKLGQALVIPGDDGAPEAAIAGYGDAALRKRGRFHLAAAAAKLPEGLYRLVSDLEGAALEQEALGWLLAGYGFDRYAKAGGIKAQLLAPEAVDAARLEQIAAGEALTRDLINTPANDMGPTALEAAVVDLAGRYGASIDAIRGEALLEQNFPMIHAVGRAAAQAPRLIDMSWGEAGPMLTLVGKGVCFDTGGLNLQPGAMRPGDILISRKGLSVEINNTDAEGRLVLADALSFAAEAAPDLMISMATLTGAARVAVGPDLSPYYSDDEAVAGALERAARRVGDPVWRMPFWDPYEGMIEPGIADLDNAPKGGFAGSITAALFLRRFAGEAARYTHFDIFGWQPEAAPARPKGGVGMGARAILDALPEVLGL